VTAPGSAGDVVRYDVVDRVATVTLHRPEARNALSAEVRRLLRELMVRADGDDGVDVIILTGADPAFCAGLDLKELAAGGTDGLAGGGAGAGEAIRGDERAGTVEGRPGPFPPLSKPVIGAINGVAVTGGFELALACDLLVASERARFADTHARIGVQPGWGLTVLLPDAVGVRRARQLSLTGNYLDAPTALAWGLVNEVVPHPALLPRCRALAADIVSNDQAGVRRILRTYAENTFTPGGDAWRNEASAARSWIDGLGARGTDLDARRRAVIERGRQQISAPPG
jgi:enoyl-CoA hydratase